MLTIIAALDRNRLIGRDGGLPWRLPDDLRRFKQLTLGKPIVMGRRTHESIGGPLPGRRNLVLSRDPAYRAGGCEVLSGLDAALAACGPDEELIVMGGSALYRDALPLADRLYLTEVDTAAEGDTWFPEFDRSAWRERSREPHPADDRHPYAFDFVCLDRMRDEASPHPDPCS